MSTDSVLETASDAYVYFYPIVENLKTLFYDSVWPHTGSYFPVNKFSHFTQLVDWTFSDVVAPNNDTLYSRAWLDLEEQPIVLSLPDVPTTATGKKVSMQGSSLYLITHLILATQNFTLLLLYFGVFFCMDT